MSLCSRFCCCLGSIPGDRSKKQYMIKSNIGSYLTTDDKRLIKESHDQAFNEMNIQEKGVDFLIKYFRAYPSQQHHFKPLKQTPLAQLYSLPFTHNHGTFVIKRIGTIISLLDNPAEMNANLVDLLHTHIPRTVKVVDMKDMLTIFVMFMRDVMGKNFTQRHTEAWMSLVASIHVALNEAETKYSVEDTEDSVALSSDIGTKIG